MSRLGRFAPLVVLASAASFGAEAQPAPPASAQTLVRTQTAPRTAALTTESNRQVIAEAFRRWAAGGRTFFQDVLAADVVWTIKGTSPAAGTYRGREDFIDRAVRPFTDRLASPVQPTVQGIWADADHVIVQWDGAGTAADGAPYRNSYVWIFRMVDQRAVEVVAFLDLVPYDDVIRRVPRPMPTVPADRASAPSRESRAHRCGDAAPRGAAVFGTGRPLSGPACVTSFAHPGAGAVCAAAPISPVSRRAVGFA